MVKWNTERENNNYTLCIEDYDVSYYMPLYKDNEIWHFVNYLNAIHYKFTVNNSIEAKKEALESVKIEIRKRIKKYEKNTIFIDDELTQECFKINLEMYKKCEEELLLLNNE